MIKAPEIWRPLPLPGIERPGQQEDPRPHLARRLEKQLVKQRLAIGGVGAHVAEVASVDGSVVGAEVDVGINASVKQLNLLRAPALAQLRQRMAAGKGK